MSEQLLDLADWLFYLRGQISGQVHSNDPAMKQHAEFLERSEKAVRYAIEATALSSTHGETP